MLENFLITTNMFLVAVDDYSNELPGFLNQKPWEEYAVANLQPALTSTIAFISAVSGFGTYTRLLGQFALYWALASSACSFKQKKLCLQTKLQ